MKATVKIGISSCLLGEKVRFDGGHKKNTFIANTMGPFLEYVPVCPEVELGLGVPRELMHLMGNPQSPHLITTLSGKDITDKMVRWARKRAIELESEDLWGFIFKSRSPSSGMKDVKVYDEKGKVITKRGVGIFARIFIEHFPLVPVEDENRLDDPMLRENFIERIFAIRRWRELLNKRKSKGRLAVFHTRHTLLILSHSQKGYRTMKKLLADAHPIPTEKVYKKYQELFMNALKIKPTPEKNVRVLQHAVRLLKRELSRVERQELLKVIDRFGQRQLPLIVPINLIQHCLNKYDCPYLKKQYYLYPDPVEVLLRNHA